MFRDSVTVKTEIISSSLVFPKTIFRFVKDGLLYCKKPHIALHFMAFYKAKSHVLDLRKLQISTGTAP